MIADTPAAGCPMVDGLYLRANGEIACWGHFGDIHNLDRFDVATLRDPDFDLVGHPKLVAIRDAFRQGRLPFPELCPTCPVLGDGTAPSSRPRRLDKLLIEPSYVCQLDCPACFSAAKRRRLGRPPWLLEPELLAAFLDRLKADGIEAVRFVHLEGRGDPMMGPHTWTLVRQVRDAFPGVEIQMTSHGVYPFEAGLFDSGLDTLRFSIDGATAESYGRYRRGGNFQLVLDHLRAIRDHRRHHGSRLRVVWKYIVFEWNDTSEELALAARLAEELEAELLFVLAEEGTGRSRRLPDLPSLGQELERLAPRAQGYECLDQLGTAGLHQVHAQASQVAAEILGRALAARRDGNPRAFLEALHEGLRLDLGPRAEPHLDRSTAEDPLPAELVEAVLRHARFPAVVAALANLATEVERAADAYRLFRLYLRLGPEAADREGVERLLIHLALRQHLGHDDLSAVHRSPARHREAAENAVLAVDPGHRPAGVPATIDDPVNALLDDLVLPIAHLVLAFLRRARGEPEGSRQLLQRLVERYPHSPEAEVGRVLLAETSEPAESPEPSESAAELAPTPGLAPG